MKLKFIGVSALILVYLILFTGLIPFTSRMFSIYHGKKYTGTIISISEVESEPNVKLGSYKYYVPRVEFIFNGNKTKVYTSNRGDLNTFKIGEKVEISYTPNSQSEFTIVKSIS